MYSGATEREREDGGGEGRNRRRGRGKRTKNEVKFIRVQTDVNLFKLRDFDRGFIVARRERLYLLSLRGTRDGRGP